MAYLKRRAFIIVLVALFVVVPSFGKAQTIDMQALQAQINALLRQIQALQQQLVQGGGSGGGPTLPSQPAIPAIQPQNIPHFDRDLFLGMRGDDVRDLQEFLTEQGYYAGPISGYYGLLTVQGVKKFQQANGITPSGYFGVRSRALANSIIEKLVGQICGEEGEGCEGNVLPREMIAIAARSNLTGKVGEYFEAQFKISGGSGSYKVDAVEVEGKEFAGGLDGEEPGEFCEKCKEPRQIPADEFVIFGFPERSGVLSFTMVVKDQLTSAYGKERFAIVIKEEFSSGRPPIISGIKGPTVLKVGEEGVWSIEAQDRGNGSLNYRVVWGDEVSYQAEAQGLTPSRQAPFRQAATFAHTYYNAGVYTPTFYVVNDRGLEARTSISVNVAGPTVGAKRVIIWTDKKSYVTGDTLHFFVKVTDPDGTPFTPEEGAQVTSYVVEPTGRTDDDAINYNPDSGYYKEDSIVSASAARGEWTVWVSVTRKGDSNVVLATSEKIKFSILSSTQPSITVTSPNGGEILELGKSYTFRWNTTGNIGPVDILIVDINEGRSSALQALTVATGVANTGSYTVVLPTDTAYFSNNTRFGAPNYKVRLYGLCNPCVDTEIQRVVDESDNVFILKKSSSTQPSIAVTSPNGGETWQAGSIYKVSWKTSGIPPTASIYAQIVQDTAYPYIQPPSVVFTTVPASQTSADLVIPKDMMIGKYKAQVEVCVLLGDGSSVCDDGRNPYYADDKSDSPFSIAAGGTTGYKLSADYISGKRSSYAAGEKISLTIKGIELFDGSPGESNEGFNVQVYIRGVNDSYSLQGVNAAYNSQTGYWEAKLTAPADTAKTYKVESSFYCSNESSVCSRRYVSGKGEAGGQVNSSFDFSVYGSGRTPVMIVSPNGGESYQAGQSTQMPIKWTADCGYKSFSLMLAKGTYSGSNNQVINDSIPAGICSSGQSAIPYYTTWPIPSNLAAGSDYKVLVTGQLADSVVGQFGTGVGDDSNASFTITAATISTPSITVLSPNGGEVIKTGERNTIRWSSTGTSLGGTVNIKLNYSPIGYLYNQIQDIIAQNAPNTGTFEWVPSEFYLTGIVPGSFRITVEAADSSDSSNSGFSVAYGLTAPRLTVSSPKGGETFVAGEIVPIIWAPRTSGNPFSLTLLKKNDSSFARWDSMYFDNALNSLVWKVPNGLSAGDYYLKVEEVVSSPDRGTIGYSNSFTVAAGSQQPSITVTSPNGGEGFIAGQNVNVFWTANGLNSNRQYRAEITMAIPNSEQRDAASGFGLTQPCYTVSTVSCRDIAVVNGTNSATLTIPFDIYRYSGNYNLIIKVIDWTSFLEGGSDLTQVVASDTSNGLISVSQSFQPSTPSTPSITAPTPTSTASSTY